MSPIEQSEMQERFKLVCEHVPLGILVADAGYRLIYANKSLRDMLGYDADGLAGTAIDALIHHDDRAFSEKLLADLVSGKRDASHLEERYLHKGGHDVWCKTDIALARDKNGHPQMFICVLEDISERRQVDVAMHRLIGQYEQILNSTGWGICGLDCNGRIAFMNAEATRMLEWEAEELAGQSVSVIMRAGQDAEQRSEAEAAIDDALHDGLIRHAEGGLFVCKDGTNFTAEYTVTPLIEDGMVSGVAILFLSRVGHAEQSARRKLLRLNSRIAPVGKRRERFEKDAGSHVEDHASAGSEWMEIDIHACIDNVLEMIGSEIGQRIEIKKRYAELPPVLCVPQQMNQLLLSLLLNACRLRNERRVITLGTGKSGEEIWVEIADGGCDVPEEHAGQIFDPFFIATLAASGAGIGLPQSYRILRNHHGRITMESEPGKRSVFRVWLPAHHEREVD